MGADLASIPEWTLALIEAELFFLIYSVDCRFSSSVIPLGLNPAEACF